MSNWKHEYGDLMNQIKQFITSHPPHNRVTSIIKAELDLSYRLLAMEINGYDDEMERGIIGDVVTIAYKAIVYARATYPEAPPDRILTEEESQKS